MNEPRKWSPSLRSQFLTARTYCRPKSEDGTEFESSEEMVDRTIEHQRILWETAKGGAAGIGRVALTPEEEKELQELREAILNGEGSLAGRTMWLGGTETSRKYQATNFNCSYTEIKTVYDVVDAFHLLLLGCLHPDTNVMLWGGLTSKVKDLKPYEEVMTYNTDLKVFERGMVLGMRQVQRRSKVGISFSDGSKVSTTDNHEFMLQEGRFVRASELRQGDKILGMKSNLEVSSVESFEDDEEFIDITVGNNHNFVLSNGAVVHNCGVGFSPVDGVLNGFPRQLLPVEGEISGFKSKPEIEVIRSTRKDKGCEFNREELYKDPAGKLVWILKVGDSGLAWAKAAGKILAMKHPVDKIILDFTEIRPSGQLLKGFGWISSGDEKVSRAFSAICQILIKRSDSLLTKIDIMDVMNWLGTGISSRRSAEMAMMSAEDMEAEEFATAKKDYWKNGNVQRGQSNNSLVFYHKPTKRELRGIFSQMVDSGGSEPGFVNGVAAKKRAPWFKGMNPCGEILLGDKSFCNLVTIALPRFNGRFNDIRNAYRLFSRANYRQTCVNLDDGTLQRTWHELNQFLRLTGAGAAGIEQWEYSESAEHIQQLRSWAREACDSMADELRLPRSKAVTTIKPDGCLESGTRVKTTEGNLPLIELFYRSGYISLSTLPTGFHPIREEIYVWDHNNQKQKITKLFNNGYGKQLKSVHLADGQIINSTPDHKFLVGADAWKEAKSLAEGDIIVKCDEGEYYGIEVLKVTNRKSSNEPVLSLDIEVENTHCYQLSSGIVSHNTVGKVLDVTEGIHRPLGRYIINNVIVAKGSKLHMAVKKAGYRVFDHPSDSSNVVVSMPVSYEGCKFTRVEVPNGGGFVEINDESAVSQLERYKLWMKNYVDHNCSITISYSTDEVEDIINWLHKNWDEYVGVSWIFRINPRDLVGDPTLIAAKLGYEYLPQYPITEEEYSNYTSGLKMINLDSTNVSSLDLDDSSDCAGGACPVR